MPADDPSPLDDYPIPATVATTLRAAVVAEAVKRRRGRGQGNRIPLSVRLDMLDPEL